VSGLWPTDMTLNGAAVMWTLGTIPLPRRIFNIGWAWRKARETEGRFGTIFIIWAAFTWGFEPLESEDA
jgi:hypothetical protein